MNIKPDDERLPKIREALKRAGGGTKVTSVIESQDVNGRQQYQGQVMRKLGKTWRSCGTHVVKHDEVFPPVDVPEEEVVEVDDEFDPFTVPIDEQISEHNEANLPVLPEHETTHTALRDRQKRTILNGARAKCYLQDGSFDCEGMVLDTYLDHRGRPVVKVRDYATEGVHFYRPENITCPTARTKGQRDYEAKMRGKEIPIPEPTEIQMLDKENNKEAKMADDEKKKKKISSKNLNPSKDGLCLCGCGEESVRRFRPGHDARLKSLFNKCLGRGKAGKKEATADDRKRCKRASSFEVMQESHYFGPLIKDFLADPDGKKLKAERKAAAEKKKAEAEKAA